MSKINDAQAGRAGEHLVCADLMLRGYTAYLIEATLAYDVLVDLSGRLVRVQVKTTRAPQSTGEKPGRVPVYRFNIRRMGKGGRGSYTSADTDIFALVALDARVVGYIAEQDAKQTMLFRLREYEGHYYDERMAWRREAISALRKEGASYRKIADSLNMDVAQAHRIASGKDGGHMESRYLDTLTFEDALNDHKPG